MKLDFTTLKAELKTLNFYQAVGLLAVAWVIVLLFVLGFVSTHGHQSWWQARYGHKVVNDQSSEPVPQTEDNNARLYLINFYKSYTGATDVSKKKDLVSKNSTADFYSQYAADKTIDDVTCTNSKITNIQITDQILFAKTPSYDLLEYNGDKAVAGPGVALNKVGSSYQIAGISCGTFSE